MSIRIYTKKEGSILENPACCCSLSGIGVSARVLGRKVSGVDDDAAQKEEGRKREEKKALHVFTRVDQEFLLLESFGLIKINGH